MRNRNSRGVFYFVALLLFTTQSQASCREESLIRFVSKSAEVPSLRIGADNPCDGFGGDQVRTPKIGQTVYVNFNIAGRIDLDAIDAVSAACAILPEERWRTEVTLAFVTRQWMNRVEKDDYDAVMNRDRDTLFISEKVLQEDRLQEIWDNFFGLACS